MRLVHGLSAVSCVLLTTFLAVPASAASISGQFNLAGSAIGTTNGIQLYLNTPGDTNAISLLPDTGSFTNLTVGSVQTIGNLTYPPVTPGTNFSDPNWVVLTDGINLDLMSIPIPSLSACPTGGTVANGTSCLVNASSPVVLTQTLNGVTAHLSVDGMAHTAGMTDYASFVGLFTAPSTPFATIADFEAYYNAHGMIPNVAYAANFTVTPSASTPEPQTVALIAGGLLVGFGLRKKLALRKG